MSSAENIAHLVDYRANAALPEAPIFFASRLVAEKRETKIVEYCALDVFGAVKLLVTVQWSAEPAHPGLWAPSTAALAALLLIGQLFEGERVVIENQTEDEVLHPLHLGAQNPEVLELRDILARRDLRRVASDLEDQIALLRFDPSRPDSAYGDALLLKACWAFVDDRLRPGLATTPSRSRFVPASPAPMEPAFPAWAWWLGVAVFVQTLAFSAQWIFPAHG
jgi:hypothetical protein